LRAATFSTAQLETHRALKPNPRLGANFVAMDPLEWLARISDHIPDPGKHRTLFYAHHADPLTCRKCGGKLRIVAYIHSHVAIRKILAHLGLSPPEQERRLLDFAAELLHVPRFCPGVEAARSGGSEAIAGAQLRTTWP